MENTPQETDLNFTISSENAVPENAVAETQIQADLFAGSAENSVAAEEVMDVETEGSDVPFAGTPAENVPANNETVDVLRSRQPMNRPAGTPPLEGIAGNENISAAELSVIGKSYGAALRMLREHNHVTYKDIELSTKIQEHYLVALENENLKALPPLVYVIAFIRNLCSYYKLSNDTSNQMVAKLKEQLEYTCNDELINSLDVDASGAEVNERRIKRFIWGIAGILLAAVLISVIVVWLVKASSRPEVTVVDMPAGKQQHFDPNTVYPLLEPPTLDLPKLPVAE